VFKKASNRLAGHHERQGLTAGVKITLLAQRNHLLYVGPHSLGLGYSGFPTRSSMRMDVTRLRNKARR